MSPLPALTLANTGQVAPTQTASAPPGSSGAFSRLQEQAANQYGPAPGQMIAQQSSPSPNAVSSSAAANALQPSLEQAGKSLSTLNSRVAGIEPASASDLLQNRLDLLNSQFRALGDSLQQSAANNDPVQLLRLQNDIYQLEEELELVSKVVDQTTSGVRTLLQTQI